MAKARAAAFVVLVLLAGACEARDASPAKSKRPDRFGIGRAATPQEIAAIDIDVNPAGAGLPEGQGTAATGALVYASKCAACHGPHGEGIDKNPKLIGKDPPAGFAFANDVKATKTIGNYWPYATTLYDYVHRAMPLTAPGSLTPDEIYGVVAFILSENGIAPATTVINKTSLPKVKMPAQSHFVTDNRKGGVEFK